MSDRLVLAASVDIFRNLANLLFLATVVLCLIAFFKGGWVWAGYAFGAGVIFRVIAAILRNKLYATQ
jgi:hypothetical protein